MTTAKIAAPPRMTAKSADLPFAFLRFTGGDLWATRGPLLRIAAGQNISGLRSCSMFAEAGSCHPSSTRRLAVNSPKLMLLTKIATAILGKEIFEFL
jgi:hypothetical protein